ncbi:MAG: 23S rRNA (uracil(1939)-C(5))-methyltransferase RlmD [Longimonas sp.]|uniref:23S rRNA (uracil(1939)-C(5))-methyltransferase RlmD n=1 Tax=Longimonas sp. TaxID=2039626 RepID=UPI0033635A57
MASVSRGDLVTLDIEKFADKGASLARIDGYVIFVEGAVPGDRVKAYLYQTKSNFAKAKLDTLIEPSDLRTEPRCRYADTCGGCARQHVKYAAQLQAKQQSVQEAFAHHSEFDGVEVPPVIGMDDPFYYRNKMDFDFSADRWLTSDEISTGQDFDTDFALGMHAPGHYDKVIDLQECHLQSELSARLVNGVRDFVKEQGWAPWDIRQQEGYLRHLVIREGKRTGDVMVNLVTYGRNAERRDAFADFLQRDFPEVTTFVDTNHTGKSHNVEGDTQTVFGPGTINDMIGDYRFKISPQSFFQTNTRQAERLYEVARDMADLRPTDTVYDLYCGAGTISLFLSDAVEHVVGVELIEEAVADARANAAQNEVANCTFVPGDLKTVFTDDFVDTHGTPDVLIVDPPRNGMHKKVVAQIEALRPERFVYVSCNPQTQVRDLDRLHDVYQIDAVQPVDMFPHTPHIENVVRLSRKG